ncbi:aldehyde reductase [Arthrobacter alpinus]|uniref:SDR family oxidoreductase n=1 Tax=Arthrobacter alpinus TaxID=656366 RepID=UPI001645047D|nr:aldehyde reductase [Arthrobacter alpinus]
MSDELVLVTGGSGFLGAHCIAALLSGRYRVRGTLRSLDRAQEVITLLAHAGVSAEGRLSFAQANLMDDVGWQDAVDGASYVLHTASPFPPTQPKDQDELLVPARYGTLRVLRAARQVDVKQVVVTSPFAAIGYGGPVLERPYTEEDWTDPEEHLSPYVRSKTLAEKAAWDFMAGLGDGQEGMGLGVVNPVGIFGPILGPRLSTSVQIVQRLMSGVLPGMPKVSSGVVDVRDVAALHVLAMTHPSARGQRFLASGGDAMSLPEISRVLHARLGDGASRVPTRVLPDLLVRLAALFDKDLAGEVVPRLGKVKHLSNDKARSVLGWAPTGRTLPRGRGPFPGRPCPLRYWRNWLAFLVNDRQLGALG